ncbi:hypothetical protein LguiB_003430 [Lonicera macranthoides]
MEAEKTTSSRSVKRKPLSDRTNIIPTSTILKLSSPLNSIPKPSSKPCKQSTNSSKSHSSVGSSNHYNNSSTTENDPKNSTRVPQIQPSTPLTKPLPHSESPNSGNGNGEIIEPLVRYKRRQTAEKSRSKGEPVAIPFASLLEKPNNDKRKLDSVVLSWAPVEKTKDKGKSIAVPSNIPNVGITKDKGKAIAVPLDIPAIMKTKDKGKAIAVPFSVPAFGKTKDKGKAVDLPLNFPPREKISNGKAVDKNFSSHSKARSVAMPVEPSTLEKRNDRSAAFSNSPLPRTRSIWNEPDEAGDIGLPKFQTDPHLKDKKKRRTKDDSKYDLPRDFVEQQRAYFKEIDEFELPVEEASDSE